MNIDDKVDALTAQGWTTDPLARRAQVEAGQTIVTNVSVNSPDKALVDWAKANGHFVYVGDNEGHTRHRRSDWFNPFKIGKENTEAKRNQVCEQYAKRLNNTPELLARLPELKGKVLGCWCYPKRCHGDHLDETNQ